MASLLAEITLEASSEEQLDRFREVAQLAATARGLNSPFERPENVKYVRSIWNWTGMAYRDLVTGGAYKTGDDLKFALRYKPSDLTFGVSAENGRNPIIITDIALPYDADTARARIVELIQNYTAKVTPVGDAFSQAFAARNLLCQELEQLGVQSAAWQTGQTPEAGEGTLQTVGDTLPNPRKPYRGMLCPLDIPILVQENEQAPILELIKSTSASLSPSTGVLVAPAFNAFEVVYN